MIAAEGVLGGQPGAAAVLALFAMASLLKLLVLAPGLYRSTDFEVRKLTMTQQRNGCAQQAQPRIFGTRFQKFKYIFHLHTYMYIPRTAAAPPYRSIVRIIYSSTAVQDTTARYTYYRMYESDTSTGLRRWDHLLENLT